VPPGVRRADPRELDRLAALWTALADHHAAFDARFALRPGADEAVRGLLAGWLRDPDAALFVSGEATLDGYCAVRVDEAPPIQREQRRAEITDLLVRESERRRGLGRALAEAALGWVRERGVDRVEVRVAAGNREGQAFWRAFGFGDFMDVLDRRL